MSNKQSAIHIKTFAGSFAENKDIARQLRLESIEPAIKEDKILIIDFTGVDGVTQSFAHALISDVIRKYSSDVLDRIKFKNCNEEVKAIISIVVDYMQFD